MEPHIYVYGIINSAEKMELQQGTVWLYSIACRDIAAVVSDYVSMENDAGTAIKEYALLHENVVEALMNKYNILPMRLMTVFNDVDQVIAMLERYYTAFKENFARLEQKVEFGLKVLWSAEEVKARIHSEIKRDEERGAFSPARRFMLKRFEKYQQEKALQTEAETLVRKIDSFFSGLAIEKKLCKLQTDKLLLNASYLVWKEVELTDAFAALKKTLPELAYQFSGPWPPYNFIILPPPDSGFEPGGIFNQALNK
ncbi:MAG: GvpL/GvpF family gas vesicle protein [Victivallaceae bacterium]|nr:GvpL/GvpF family gas vesicle protein [Victivallaceae bacterium]